jgi:hypothetical protein
MEGIIMKTMIFDMITKMVCAIAMNHYYVSQQIRTLMTKPMLTVGKLLGTKKPIITISYDKTLEDLIATLKEDGHNVLLASLEEQIAVIRRCVNRAETILRKQGATFKCFALNVVLEHGTDNHHYNPVTNTIVLSLDYVPFEYSLNADFFNNLMRIHGINFANSDEILEFVFWHEFGHYYDNMISHVNGKTIRDIKKDQQLRNKINSTEYYNELCHSLMRETVLENFGLDAKTIAQKLNKKVSERISYEYRMMPKEYYADNFAKNMLSQRF